MKKFDDLFVFVTIVERHSFVAAARQLRLPPSAVSRKINELEKRLGITLLNRTTRRLGLTEAGREVYESAARGFAAIAEAENMAAAHQQTPHGVLRIIAPYTVLYRAILPILPEFRALYPHVRFEFLVTNQNIDLTQNNCDLAIRVGLLQDSPYMRRLLLTSEFRLVATPAALERIGRPKRPADLMGLPMAGMLSGASGVSTPLPAPIAWSFVKGDRREELTFQFAVAASDPIVALDFALRGQGLALLAETIARASIVAEQLEIVLEDWQIAERLELSIIYRQGATKDPKIRFFVDFLLDKIRNGRD